MSVAPSTTATKNWVDQVYVGNYRIPVGDPVKVRLTHNQQVKDLGSIEGVLSGYRLFLKNGANKEGVAQDKLVELETKLTAERAKANAWKSEVDRLEGEITKLKEQQDAGASARGLALAKELESTKKSLDDAHEAARIRSGVCDKLTSEVAELRKNLDYEKSLSSAAYEEINLLRRKIEDLTVDYEKILDENNSLKNSSVNLSTAPSDTSLEIATLKSQVSSLVQQMATISAAFPWLNKVTAP